MFRFCICVNLNYWIITILPKVKDVEKIQQDWNICLLNCQHKWVLVPLRLKPLSHWMFGC
jgi:hypothetical protein